MQDLSPEERAKVMAEVAKAVRRPLAAQVGQGGGGPGGRRWRSWRMSAVVRGNGTVLPKRSGQRQTAASGGSETRSWTCCSAPACWPTSRSSSKRSRTRSTFPNQAVFERDGKQVVYVRKGKAWEERVDQAGQAQRIGDGRSLVA